MKACCWHEAGAFLLGLIATPALAGDLVLFDFTKAFDVSKAAVSDARVSAPNPLTGGAALRVVTGHQQPWPGITLTAPGGHWDLSAYAEVVLRMKNNDSAQVRVFCRVDNPWADGTRNCVTDSVDLRPGQTAMLRVPLKRTSDDKLGGKLFGMRGYPVTGGGPGTIEARNINQLVVFVNKPGPDHQFEIQDIRARGTYTPPTAWATDADPFFPCIDSFGQYRHKKWPGKIDSLVDLKRRGEQEANDLARHPGPKEWDQYGGWGSGPKLEATGFFRTQKVRDKWWLVDPLGRLFFSHGVDCVLMFDTTPIEARGNWFADFPGKEPEFAPFRTKGYALKGYYAGRSPECFSFTGANLLRKYGSNWRQTYSPLVHRRLRSWGLNTIANWSDAATRRLRLTPYTDTFGSEGVKRIEASEGYWGKFPDVFDPGFAEALRRSMEAKRGDSAGDQWCIGYFSDNEMSWGDEPSLAEAVLQSPSEQAAKQAFMADLLAKYTQIEALNQVWGTRHASWDALLMAREAPDRAKAHDDLAAFYTHAAEQYFRTVRNAIKAVAPAQLYLGCRFSSVNDRAAAAAAKFCDVVSYNLYQRSVADFQFNGGADVPLIIGEFHFGALDRGLFHTGLVPVANQAARAQAYQEYVRGALRHPRFVGCHWFQYFDEPTTGRVYDEENYQIGFVDIADTPYAELIAASREVGYHLY